MWKSNKFCWTSTYLRVIQSSRDPVVGRRRRLPFRMYPSSCLYTRVDFPLHHRYCSLNILAAICIGRNISTKDEADKNGYVSLSPSAFILGYEKLRGRRIKPCRLLTHYSLRCDVRHVGFTRPFRHLKPFLRIINHLFCCDLAVSTNFRSQP